MSDSNTNQKYELDCLRLASDLAQMSTEALNPALKAHCDRMAVFWIDLLFSGPTDEIAPPNYLLH